LYAIYGETRQTDKYLNATAGLFKRDPNPENGINLASASLVNGDYDALINEIEKFEIINPNLKAFKLLPYLFKGEVAKATKILEEFKTKYPKEKNIWGVYDTVVNYLGNNNIDLQFLKQFDGRYRSNYNEQTFDLWHDNNKIIQYAKNQSMDAFVPAGPNSIVGGNINNRTWRYDLIKNASNKPIAIEVFQNDFNSSTKNWFWKEDESIRNAHDSINSEDLDEAIKLYEM